MKRSEYVRLIEGEAGALCYHSLFGNLYFLEPAYVAVLKSFNGSSHFSLAQQPIINELIQAGYLVEKNVDERELLRQRNASWIEKVVGGGQLHLLNLIISEVCNLGCPHCLHTCSLLTSGTHGTRKLMDWETARRAIDAYVSLLRQWDVNQLNVHFGSAEPLINWAVLKRSIEHLRQLDPSASLAINTNLTLLDYEKAEFLRDNRVYIATSLDGPLEGNDAIRFLPSGKGTFTTILSKFRMLSEIGYPLDGFSITIKDQNLPFLDRSFIEWAHDFGFKGVATDVDLINQSGSGMPLSEAIAKLMELRQACLSLGMENFGTWTTPYHNLVNEPEDGMPTFCKAIKGRNLSVNPEGRIFICGHTSTPLGILERLDQVFAADSPYVRLVASRLPGNDPACFGCEIEGVCAGQCQITREVSRNTGNGRDSLLCRFYRMVTGELLKEKLAREATSI